MQWTSNPPTEAGWYWLKPREGSAEVVRVCKDYDGLYMMVAGNDDDKSIKEYAPHCQWYGPILPPS